jgi:hypothetical protein
VVVANAALVRAGLTWAVAEAVKREAEMVEMAAEQVARRRLPLPAEQVAALTAAETAEL